MKHAGFGMRIRIFRLKCAASGIDILLFCFDSRNPLFKLPLKTQQTLTLSQCMCRANIPSRLMFITCSLTVLLFFSLTLSLPVFYLQHEYRKFYHTNNNNNKKYSLFYVRMSVCVGLTVHNITNILFFSVGRNLPLLLNHSQLYPTHLCCIRSVCFAHIL